MKRAKVKPPTMGRPRGMAAPRTRPLPTKAFRPKPVVRGPMKPQPTSQSVKP